MQTKIHFLLKKTTQYYEAAHDEWDGGREQASEKNKKKNWKTRVQVHDELLTLKKKLFCTIIFFMNFYNVHTGRPKRCKNEPKKKSSEKA